MHQFSYVLQCGIVLLIFDPEQCLKVKHHTMYRFDLVGFYGISTNVGYLMPNPLYTYILNIYDLVWLGFMAYQPL